MSDNKKKLLDELVLLSERLNQLFREEGILSVDIGAKEVILDNRGFFNLFGEQPIVKSTPSYDFREMEYQGVVFYTAVEKPSRGRSGKIY